MEIRGTIPRSAIVGAMGVMVLAAAGLAATPAAAVTAADSAATAYTDGYTVRYTAGDTSSNVSITQGEASDLEFVIDDIVPIAAGEGCVHPDAADATRVVCTLPEGEGDYYTQVKAGLGRGDDTLWLRGGDDNIVYGGAGNDTLDVDLNTMTFGNEGYDWLKGGWFKNGGDGADTLTRFAVDAYGFGGDGNDYLRGGEGQQVLYGGRGHDAIEPRGGADFVFGNGGQDGIYGGKGNDDLYGGEGDDTIYGNSGNDYLRGGAGRDFLSGGPGTDDVK